MYHNPVKVIETDDWLSVLDEQLNIREIENPLIVTSKGSIKRNNLDVLLNGYKVFTDIENNPNFDSCKRAVEFARGTSCDSVIAIGGGSVMDTAKVIIAAMDLRIYELRDLFNFKGMFENNVDKIFIPTTHGSASEVTMWGTIWNIPEKQKYSLTNPALYPDVAILDPKLTLSMNLKLSISTTLDALSHGFESLWNINSNSKSIDYAVSAIKIIMEEVQNLKSNPDELGIRRKLLKASNLAGLAFSNTTTAAAHSISYPLTFLYNIPHGIACSLPLIPLIDINENFFKDNLTILLNSLETNLTDLKKQILKIPEDVIDFNLKSWNGRIEDFEEIVERSFTNSRIKNNIVDLSKDDVYNILKKIF